MPCEYIESVATYVYQEFRADICCILRYLATDIENDQRAKQGAKGVWYNLPPFV